MYCVDIFLLLLFNLLDTLEIKTYFLNNHLFVKIYLTYTPYSNCNCDVKFTQV